MGLFSKHKSVWREAMLLRKKAISAKNEKDGLIRKYKDNHEHVRDFMSKHDCPMSGGKCKLYDCVHFDEGFWRVTLNKIRRSPFDSGKYYIINQNHLPRCRLWYNPTGH